MYKILGGDGNEYGPVSADTLRQWVREGRANALTQVKVDGAAHWQPLSAFPELTGTPAAATDAPPTIGAFSAGVAPGLAGAPHEGDYELDIMACVSRAFDLFKNNLGVLILGTLIAFSPQILSTLIRLPSFLPVIGVLFTLVGLLITFIGFVIGGPLLGGLYSMFLKLGRGQSTETNDAFSGFKTNFLHLFLVQLVRGLLVGACMIPFIVVLFLTVFLAIIQNPQHTPPELSAFLPALITSVVTLPFVIWLSVNWTFALPLVMDKQLDFWTAMKTSWRQVSRHWWMVFGLTIVMALINVAGFLLCFVGLLFTQPIAIGAMLQAYETLFNPRATHPGQGA